MTDAHASTDGALVAASFSAASTTAVRDAQMSTHRALGAVGDFASPAATVSDTEAALKRRLRAVGRAAALTTAVCGAEASSQRGLGAAVLTTAFTASVGDTVAALLGALDAALVATPTTASMRDTEAPGLSALTALRYFAEATGLVELAEGAEEAVGRTVAVLLGADDGWEVGCLLLVLWHVDARVGVGDEAQTHALAQHGRGDCGGLTGRRGRDARGVRLGCREGQRELLGLEGRRLTQLQWELRAVVHDPTQKRVRELEHTCSISCLW